MRNIALRFLFLAPLAAPVAAVFGAADLKERLAAGLVSGAAKKVLAATGIS